MASMEEVGEQLNDVVIQIGVGNVLAFSSAEAAAKVSALSTGLLEMIAPAITALTGRSEVQKCVTEITVCLGLAATHHYSPAAELLETAAEGAKHNPHVFAALELFDSGDRKIQEHSIDGPTEIIAALNTALEALATAHSALTTVVGSSQVIVQGSSEIAEHYGRATLEIKQYCEEAGIPEPPATLTA